MAVLLSTQDVLTTWRITSHAVPSVRITAKPTSANKIAGENTCNSPEPPYPFKYLLPRIFGIRRYKIIPEMPLTLAAKFDYRKLEEEITPRDY